MRRPAPPPPSEEVELDYGSAETPSGSGAHLVGSVGRNEVEASANHTQAPTTRRGRKLLAYETDELESTAPLANNAPAQNTQPPGSGPPPPASTFKDNALNAPLSFGRHMHETFANAEAGPSSLAHQPTAGFSSRKDLAGGNDAGISSHAELWQPDPAQHPPPPAYPPPDLPQGSGYQPSSHYAYDPHAPEFHPAQPFSPEGPNEHYGSSDLYHPEAMGEHAHPAGFGFSHPAYALPYDPQAPYDPDFYSSGQQPFHPYAAYNLPPDPCPHPFPATVGDAYSPTSYMHPQMNVGQQKRLLKQQRRKEKKKQRKREREQAAKFAEYNAYSDAYIAAPSSASIGDVMDDDNVAWVEDGKSVAVAMIKELHARGVPPQRLIEKGVPLHMIEACCSELGISMQGEERHEVDNSATPAQPASPIPAGVSEETQGVVTPAEKELLAKQEQGVALTPLEELRKKVLASRTAKVAAGSAAANSTSKSAEASSTAASSTPNIFDRRATSGEADALLSQIGESIRGLMRPSDEPRAGAPMQDPSAGLPSSRKRTYRDVDAVDDADVNITADLAGDEMATGSIPSRRQRISYADTFSRTAQIPSGEVDLHAPVPDLPDLSMSAAKSPHMSHAVPGRRPVAADFDTEEYRPQALRVNRFLDVPSGLNTVVDLSDDEDEDEDLDSFEMSKSAQLQVDAGEVVLLRQKTATEHYDTFCALNGIQPIRRALTPVSDGASKAVEARDHATPGGGVSKEALVAQVAASNTAGAGSSTPSREELLRKELEIKQLMQKIQMMEERKSRQQAATLSPSASPMPSGPLQPANGANTAPVSGPSMPLANTTQAVGIPAASALQKEVHAPPQSASQSAAAASRLDPELQKKREELLALLASKRKATTTVKAPDNVVESNASNNSAARSDHVPVNAPAPNGTSTESITISPPGDRKEVSPQPSVVSRYRPVVPSVFQSITSKVRSYLPQSLGFSLSPSPAGPDASERTSIKWCPREADGHECSDARCSQRHVREFRE